MAAKRRAISMAEVAKHSTEEDGWMVVHGLVVKLSKDFLDEHPGGPDVVTCLAGKDATQDFEDISHSDSARKWASEFIIGYTEDKKDEEGIETKMIPKNAEVTGGSGGGGLGGMIPALIVVIVAVVASVMMFGKK
mmetsp:Transcript_78629/g.138638  ORF Transcript_78629/g.138638 Transcript_78629/m.138638 type:complete len:135 (+) Transcript_78629:73-477(+)|eukprot:CAMPEP_0197643810 /NCGR_PEP_ID=MMETSP1338-20131121/16995_1 /TAXON_ID=43686 ORGANISM="Pelagodinium beii, Strain RCC1491" /NCGR_SAMPLE_ID=MMETSP1338 /ASSEMBLY_ACC=CAM_ASM_000754 /LENGTH=134 /DNA_ID=CAMNT_0043217099 /DNA_START=88 /DNA_END=492 /DNA_ORIENTATION=+